MRSLKPETLVRDGDQELGSEDGDAEAVFKPLTRDEVQKLREANQPVSPWRVLVIQAVVGVLVAVLAWVVTGRVHMAWSAGYGALSVVIPAALFVRGLLRQQAAGNAGAAMAGFFIWEMVKIVLTVAMLFAAPKLIDQLNWLALLAGFVVTMKVYWATTWFSSIRKTSIKINE